ncbi:sulfotransferase family protein [Azospirillum halopraeferens]|uniref:sulfotransferase family protein n=1 Tax=Azospirillum halopraeferens TaxID=34010 RepID=UPI00146FA0D7|nr:sulfotransferase [Azospirillum halopraeferens]
MSESFQAVHERVAAALERDLFFIAGAPHAGTTAVQLALDAHPEIRCAGEGHFTDWIGTPLKDLLGAYNAKLEANNAALYGGAGAYGGFTTGDFRHLLRTAMGLALARLEVPPGTRRVGEATPAYALRLDVLEALFPTAGVLHVVRDGRTAVAAALAAVDAVRPDSESWYGLVETVARDWTTAVQKSVVFGASRPDRYHEVRIEDLTADPAPHLAAVLRFLGVDDTVPLPVPALPEPPPLDDRATAIVLRHQEPLLRQFGYL